MYKFFGIVFEIFFKSKYLFLIAVEQTLNEEMKKILLIAIIILGIKSGFSQKYYTEIGVTEFDGSKAAFEPIKAINKNTTSIIDFKTGNIAAVIIINQFEFRLRLMQEHFNENYLESNIYPRSTFEGKIINFNDITENFKNYQITGNLTIKGVTKEINTTALIRKEKNKVELMSNFSVMLSDFGVKIPKIVFKKIDEEVKINLNFVYDEKN
tara:strand:+ start:1261 stop:1893 length:633 start_codon:yes stop_codon:yes gene_type:complete